MSASTSELAVFGGGCFWCVEAVFRALRGVLTVTPGYAGGETANPDYAQVCAGTSGHIEVAAIRYDPEQISYAQLLDVFFASHDPTSLDRQGADSGPQYRSVIFCQDPHQRHIAEQKITWLQAEGVYATPIVTELRAACPVWPAENAHHDYYAKHPQQGYCRVVIAPKLAQLRAGFAALLRPPH